MGLKNFFHRLQKNLSPFQDGEIVIKCRYVCEQFSTVCCYYDEHNTKYYGMDRN